MLDLKAWAPVHLKGGVEDKCIKENNMVTIFIF